MKNVIKTTILLIMAIAIQGAIQAANPPGLEYNQSQLIYKTLKKKISFPSKQKISGEEKVKVLFTINEKGQFIVENLSGDEELSQYVKKRIEQAYISSRYVTGNRYSISIKFKKVN